MNETMLKGPETFLDGLRVLEVADELGEYCGKVLAGLGADVVKVEPPGGEVTRGYGPFHNDLPHVDRSLHFWHYNFGKRSIVLDLDEAQGQNHLKRLAASADVVIDSRPKGYLADRGLGSDELRRSNPGLIYVRISAFGDDGPWADHVGSDLVHLALGGVMMNCGYDPNPFDQYDTPPIAPQPWHAYAITGEMAVITVLGALHYRLKTGRGQYLSASVHDAVSKATETDLPDWVFHRENHFRHTGRRSKKSTTASPGIVMTKDGRYILPYSTYLKGMVDAWPGTLRLLKKYKMAGETELDYDDVERYSDHAAAHIRGLTDKLVGKLLYGADLWWEGQQYGLPWAPVRRPEENVSDPHFKSRGTFLDVEHPELGSTYTHIGARWVCHEAPWARGLRPPLLGEHTEVVIREWLAADRPTRPTCLGVRADQQVLISKRGKPFAIDDLRVVDLGWMLASAGAGRYLAALGAEVIKVEHESRADGMRFGIATCPPGGRDERERAVETLQVPASDDPNRSGAFMEYNAGKLSLSLNLKTEDGKRILEDLIRGADILLEGYSPGTLERLGFGYDRLKELNPGIVYVSQSGFGAQGTYGRARALGPTAQAISGVTDQSGFPAPYPPAGIGFSYLDWFGAYNMVTAALAGIYRRDISGAGCHVDSSQAEAGIYLTGPAVLDHSVNGRQWDRHGNRSPYKLAAPHGAYRARGEDRWIAVSVFDEKQWQAMAAVLGRLDWLSDPRYATMQARLLHQDALDEAVGEETKSWDRYALMDALQGAGVPAGVCQNAEDRCEIDPQLRETQWRVELDQTEIGRWPVKEHPVLLSETPAYIGGRHDRSGPNYGEDTDYVLSEIVGLDETCIKELRNSGVV